MKLFKRALIYDGTGSEPFKGDILVENDKIVKVAISIEPEYYADLTVFDEAELRNGKPDQDKSCVFHKSMIISILAQMPAWRGRQASELKHC